MESREESVGGAAVRSRAFRVARARLRIRDRLRPHLETSRPLQGTEHPLVACSCLFRCRLTEARLDVGVEEQSSGALTTGGPSEVHRSKACFGHFCHRGIVSERPLPPPDRNRRRVGQIDSIMGQQSRDRGGPLGLRYCLRIRRPSQRVPHSRDPSSLAERSCERSRAATGDDEPSRRSSSTVPSRSAVVSIRESRSTTSSGASSANSQARVLPIWNTLPSLPPRRSSRASVRRSWGEARHRSNNTRCSGAHRRAARAEDSSAVRTSEWNRSSHGIDRKSGGRAGPARRSSRPPTAMSTGRSRCHSRRRNAPEGVSPTRSGRRASQRTRSRARRILSLRRTCPRGAPGRRPRTGLRSALECRPGPPPCPPEAPPPAH